MPSNALDANGLLRTAIRCDDPVLFLEHKHLYRQTHNKGLVPRPGLHGPVRQGGERPGGRGRHDRDLRRDGVPLVAGGQAVRRRSGDEVEILDLRTLAPYDWEAIAAAVRKTGARHGRLRGQPSSWGYGAEIAARIAAELFAHLDAPVRARRREGHVRRLRPELEDVILPQVATLATAMSETARY